MAKEQLQQGDSAAPAAKSKKGRRVRLIIGVVLIVLVVAFSGVNIIDMRQRINAETDEAARSLLWRGLQNDYIVFAGLLIVALGITFGIMPARRPLPLRIIGCVVWIAGLVITAETAYLAVQTVIHSRQADVDPEAQKAVVVGMALNPNSSAPFDLNARLNTAAAWWQDHQEHELIVTAGTDYIPVESADGGDVTSVEGTQNTLAGRGDDRKKKGTSTPSVMQNLLRGLGVTPRWITQEKNSKSLNEIFGQVVSMRGMNADTPIIVITNGCYMNDTVRLARQAGFTRISRLPADSSVGGYLTSILWETWLENDPLLKAAQ